MSSSMVLSLLSFCFYCLLGFNLTNVQIIPQRIGLWHQFDQDKDGQQTCSSVKFCQVAVAVGSIAPMAMFVFVILWPKDPLTCLQVMVNLSKLSCWKGQKQHYSTWAYKCALRCVSPGGTQNVKKGPLYTQVEPWSLNSPSKSRLVRNSQFRMNWKNTTIMIIIISRYSIR